VEAFARGPDHAAGYAMAAWTLLVQQSVAGLPLSADARSEALRLARMAAKVANEDAFALARAGHVLAYLGQEYDRGASLVERAIDLNPHLASAWFSRGWVAVLCGEAERSVESFERMIRLSPLDPLRTGAWIGSSWALFCLGRYL